MTMSITLTLTRTLPCVTALPNPNPYYCTGLCPIDDLRYLMASRMRTIWMASGVTIGRAPYCVSSETRELVESIVQARASHREECDAPAWRDVAIAFIVTTVVISCQLTKMILKTNQRGTGLGVQNRGPLGDNPPQEGQYQSFAVSNN